MTEQSVLISIQPKWVEEILSSEKTVEVRKSKPMLEVPFKCYIYCTQADRNFSIEKNSDVVRYQRYCNRKGKVVAEFTCNYISQFTCENGGFLVNHDLTKTYDCLAQSRLTDKEFREYAKEETVYGWHISDLVVYDKPKELSEFGLNRPPQSWCYVEGMEGQT